MLQTVVLEAEMASVTDDDVVEDLKAEHFSSLAQSFDEQDIPLTRLDVSARMIVDEEDRSSRFSDGGLVRYHRNARWRLCDG